MLDIFDEERSHNDHWNADCFLLFVLSHGSHGNVYGIDGHKLSIEKDIVTKFDGNNCPALVNKPKMFFIQACQGGGYYLIDIKKIQMYIWRYITIFV